MYCMVVAHRLVLLSDERDRVLRYCTEEHHGYIANPNERNVSTVKGGPRRPQIPGRLHVVRTRVCSWHGSNSRQKNNMYS
eukprot:scaffold12636_cov176-Amphora_coffeaeformis.AAC.6